MCIFAGFFLLSIVAHEVQKLVQRWQHNAEKGFLDMPEHIPSHHVPPELIQSDVYQEQHARAVVAITATFDCFRNMHAALV